MSVSGTGHMESLEHRLAVTLEDLGEHHMGASTVIVRLSRPLEGVAEFCTTNGNAFFTPDGRGLVIHDACVILFADLVTEKFYNVEPPAGWYYTRVGIDDNAIVSNLYNYQGARSEIVPIPLSKITTKMAEGTGGVVHGRFPSAYP